MQQRIFTQEEFRKELLEGTVPFLVDLTTLSPENLKLVKKEYRKLFKNFPEEHIKSFYFGKGGIEVGVAWFYGWIPHNDRDKYANYIIKVLQERTMTKVTDKEKLEHLLAGGVITGDGVFRKLDNNGMFAFCEKDGTVRPENNCTCIDFTDDIVLPWYRNIPEEGVVCFVWDRTAAKRVIHTIVAYHPHEIYSYKCNVGCEFTTAVPLTSEQLALYKQLMDSCSAL